MGHPIDVYEKALNQLKKIALVILLFLIAPSIVFGYLLSGNAVSSIKKYPGVNPEKIGMWGHSLGGFLTLRAMVMSPDIKAGVIWAGVVGSYPDLINNWRRATGTPFPLPSGARR